MRTESIPPPGRHSTPPPRLVDHAAERLERLCVAAGLADERERAARTLRDLVSPWGDARLGAPSRWTSDISDDNTPIELSVAMSQRRAEVRVLFEAQAREPTLRALRREGLALHARLARDYGADLTRFEQVRGLFLPEDIQGSFAVWSAAVFARGAAPAFKTYFNPQARGRGDARALTEAALARLGMPRAVASLDGTALRRGALDELKYVALDLDGGPRSRVKVYVRHHGATPADIEVASSAAASYVAGEALDFARAMRGADATLDVRAPFTCSAFTADGGADLRPASTTVYVPVCAYARDDAAVRARIQRYMLDRGLDPSGYESLVDRYANRPLASGVGMQAWFAVRTWGGETRFTLYLATEANRVHAPGTVPAPSEPVAIVAAS